ncbi:MAG: nucleoside phosphorylase [Bacteroidales bacterium]|nr:nucleoside phosphorylase [Bacteroidales bacterium]
MKHTELMTTAEGKLFHLHIGPDDIADTIIIVGDQGRVDLIGDLLKDIRFDTRNREFRSVTGTYGQMPVTIMSSGIGTDNIDILINELDAAVNFNLNTKEPLDKRRSLRIIRIGTTGALQGDMDTGSWIASARAIGFDGVLNFYSGVETVTDPDFEKAFMEHMSWLPRLATPYIADADPVLLKIFEGKGIRSGITVSAPGFYAPQGRTLSLAPADAGMNDRLESFLYKGQVITNYEMESSAIYGLSALLGHRALTICTVIGNRVTGKFLEDYKPAVKNLAVLILDTLQKGG